MYTRALIIIDLLNDFLDQWSDEDRVDLVRSTNELITHFRSFDLPVIWVRQEFQADLSDAFLEMRTLGIRTTIKGTHGAEIDSSLDRRDNDAVVVKKRYSAFFNTSLESILVELGVRELTICGINTHACVRMAAIDAYQRDIGVVIASECIGTYDHVHGDVSLRYMNGKIAKVKSNDEIMSASALE
jgi:maleamate amidohydrolase